MIYIPPSSSGPSGQPTGPGMSPADQIKSDLTEKLKQQQGPLTQDDLETLFEAQNYDKQFPSLTPTQLNDIKADWVHSVHATLMVGGANAAESASQQVLDTLNQWLAMFPNAGQQAKTLVGNLITYIQGIFTGIPPIPNTFQSISDCLNGLDDKQIGHASPLEHLATLRQYVPGITQAEIDGIIGTINTLLTTSAVPPVTIIPLPTPQALTDYFNALTSALQEMPQPLDSIFQNLLSKIGGFQSLEDLQLYGIGVASQFAPAGSSTPLTANQLIFVLMTNSYMTTPFFNPSVLGYTINDPGNLLMNTTLLNWASTPDKASILSNGLWKAVLNYEVNLPNHMDQIGSNPTILALVDAVSDPSDPTAQAELDVIFGITPPQPFPLMQELTAWWNGIQAIQPPLAISQNFKNEMATALSKTNVTDLENYLNGTLFAVSAGQDVYMQNPWLLVVNSEGQVVQDYLRESPAFPTIDPKVSVPSPQPGDISYAQTELLSPTAGPDKALWNSLQAEILSLGSDPTQNALKNWATTTINTNLLAFLSCNASTNGTQDSFLSITGTQPTSALLISARDAFAWQQAESGNPGSAAYKMATSLLSGMQTVTLFAATAAWPAWFNATYPQTTASDLFMGYTPPPKNQAEFNDLVQNISQIVGGGIIPSTWTPMDQTFSTIYYDTAHDSSKDSSFWTAFQTYVQTQLGSQGTASALLTWAQGIVQGSLGGEPFSSLQPSTQAAFELITGVTPPPPPFPQMQEIQAWWTAVQKAVSPIPLAFINEMNTMLAEPDLGSLESYLNGTFFKVNSGGPDIFMQNSWLFSVDSSGKLTNNYLANPPFPTDIPTVTVPAPTSSDTIWLAATNYAPSSSAGKQLFADLLSAINNNSNFNVASWAANLVSNPNFWTTYSGLQNDPGAITEFQALTGATIPPGPGSIDVNQILGELKPYGLDIGDIRNVSPSGWAALLREIRALRIPDTLRAQLNAFINLPLAQIQAMAK